MIDNTYKISVAISNLVNDSYQDMGEKIRNKNFSIEAIEPMEVRYSDLSKERANLADSLSKTKSEANELFSLLQTNADENSTPELKRRMLSDISVNKKAFSERIVVAEGILSKITESIKKYNDILGFLKNKVALKDVDEYIQTIDKTIENAIFLNRDVQTALIEGRQIIQQYEQISSPSQLPTSPLPTSPIPIPTPSESISSANRPFLGAQIVNLTRGGVMVTGVDRNSPAAVAGIQRGDLIVAIDGKAVTDVEEVQAQIERSAVGAELTLEVGRNRQYLQVPVRLSTIPN